MKVEVEVPDEQIERLLDLAFSKPSKDSKVILVKPSGGPGTAAQKLMSNHGYVDVEVRGEGVQRLDRDSIQKGLRVMANDRPHQFYLTVTYQEDYFAADVFLQCCLFGTVVW